MAETQALRSALAGFWAFVFPARCLGCGRRGHALCPPCAATLPLLPADVCPRCALPLRPAAACRACRRLSPALTAIRAVCAYQGLARAAVHTLKFRQGRYLAPLLGDYLRADLVRRPLAADLVAPAPIAPGRLRARGYNHAALLAEEVVAATGGALATGLLARADRPPQASLAAIERRHNLAGAVWCADPAAAAGARVLMVDDVATTGATLSACADALIAAGAARVTALVFARDL